MANVTDRTSSNVFYQARWKASTHNDALSSREGAADIMSIDKGRLYRIESGLIFPYPEEIRLMADLYNAPELENYFCSSLCPLGRDIPKITDYGNFERTSLKALSVLRRSDEVRNLILDITDYAESGGCPKEEDLDKLVAIFDEFELVAKEVKLWAKKNKNK